MYLFLDYLLLNQAWFTLGRWNLESRSGPQKFAFFPLQNVVDVEDGRVEGRSELGQVTIDVKAGRLQVGREATSLGVLKIHDGKRLHTRKYDKGSGIYAELFMPGRMGVLADRRTANTILVKLYYEYTYNRHFFSPMEVGNSYYAIWKVTGESYRPVSLPTL